MAMYPPKELDLLWRQDRLTAEQAVGQLIQHFLDQQQRITELEKRVRQLEQRTPPQA